MAPLSAAPGALATAGTGVHEPVSNAEVGRALFIGEATVKTDLLRAFEKLGVTDRTAAVTAAYRLGLLEL
jgi:ATP/maltotriose-dependent transcriptional regulator MalT